MIFRNRCNVFEITATTGYEVAKSTASCSVTLATTNFRYRLGADVGVKVNSMNKKLDKNQLLQLLDKIMQPNLYGLSEADSDAVMLDFCAGCPDPVRARWLLVECLDPLSDEELVDHALAMPLRIMKDIPPSQFPESHPLRARSLLNLASYEGLLRVGSSLCNRGGDISLIRE